MKLTLNWLNNYVDIEGLTVEEIAGHLTMLGLEVDSVTNLYEELSPLRTGLVVSAERHPDADKLTVCMVQIGDETHQIVCGAPNVRQGLKVVVALPGTVLPGDFKISKSKIRGVASGGMICSEREMGLGTDHDGIMELPEDVEHGQSFIEVMGLADVGVEVDITPNRADCTSVIGIAREIAGITGRSLKMPVCGAEVKETSNSFSVTIEAPELCHRYGARMIRNVKIAKSPWWLRRTLLSVGLRPINNIVDITNYVMLEYGHPLHAFDFDNLAGGKIVVRNPRENELDFTTLDESPRKLESDMLMICDGAKPVAVAGVMGGLNSEVSNETTTVLLESACFNPISVRRTARRLNLATDASYRFERGVDPLGAINAMDRAAQLMAEISGGEIEASGADVFPGKREPLVLSLSAQRASDLIGVSFTPEKIKALLESIEIKCEIVDSDQLQVTAPSFRVDIEREADLIEEVARVYGYDNIPTTLPSVDLSYPEQDPARLKRLFIAERLTTVGFTEAINYSFIGEKQLQMLELAADDPRLQVVRLLNPLSEEQGVMRTTLLPGLLDNVRRNINHQKSAVKLFELGKVFSPTEPNMQPVETNCLAGVLSGNRFGESSPYHFKADNVDIYDTKGAVEFILREMAVELSESQDALHFEIISEEKNENYAEAGYSVALFNGTQLLGCFSKMRSEVLRRFGIKNEVFFFDLDFDALCELEAGKKQFTALPTYPSVVRDIALVVPETIQAGEILNEVRCQKDKLIESCEIFDVYTGDKIEKGHKSVAVSITYRSATKTLTEKNVEKSHGKILANLTKKFGGSLRNA